MRTVDSDYECGCHVGFDTETGAFAEHCATHELPVPAGHFRIAVATAYGPLLPQDIRASSLREALTRAYAVPFIHWFPEEPG